MGSESERIERAISQVENQDPEHILETAILNFHHAAESNVQDELKKVLDIVRKQAKAVRHDEHKSPFTLERAVNRLRLRFESIPSLSQHVTALRRAVNQCIEAGIIERKIKKEKQS